MWVASAWCLSGEAVAQATPQPMVGPLGFEVAPEAGSWRWRFVLSNRGDAPMPVVADRRLVWVEVAPPAAPQGVRRPRRRARVARCVHDGRPASNEASPEVVLGAGDRYAESFDLRDLCNLRVPAGAAEGATVVFHYGFAVPRRGRTRLSRSVVRDERAESVNDLTASVTVPAMPTALAMSPMITTTIMISVSVMPRWAARRARRRERRAASRTDRRGAVERGVFIRAVPRSMRAAERLPAVP